MDPNGNGIEDPSANTTRPNLPALPLRPTHPRIAHPRALDAAPVLPVINGPEIPGEMYALLYYVNSILVLYVNLMYVCII